MGKKADKRDVLAEILDSVDEDVIEELDSLYEIIQVESAEHSAPDKSAKKKPPSKTAPKRSKKKTSHYLTRAVYEELNNAKTDLRDFLPSLPKSNLTKSSIVNIALKTILKEYKEKGIESTLIQKLLSQHKK